MNITKHDLGELSLLQLGRISLGMSSVIVPKYNQSKLRYVHVQMTSTKYIFVSSTK